MLKWHKGECTNVKRKRTLLVEVARAYYERDYTQQEIAQTLGLSRSQVSRYLSEAREQGIVQIRIIDPDTRANEVEDALKARFPALRDALVVPAFTDQAAVLVKTVGRACAEYLRARIAPGQRLCIGCGRTLRETVNWMRKRTVSNVTVIQAMGSLGHEAALNLDFNELARAAADKLGARVLYLNAPAVLGAGTATELAAANPSIAHSLRLARTADVYVVGLGSPAADYLYVRTGAIGPEDLDAVAQRGAVGDICGRYFDLWGQVCVSTFDARVVGITLDDLRRAPLSVGVAGGAQKVAPLLGALRGEFINVVVTDEQTARQVLALADSTERGV